MEAEQYKIDSCQLSELFSSLNKLGFRVLAPVVEEDVIRYGDVNGQNDLPQGMTCRQSPGKYELLPSNRPDYFYYTVSPDSLKNFLHPQRELLFKATRQDGEVSIHPTEVSDERIAVIGVRACEIAALHVQDRVFLKSEYVDEHYQAKRENLFVVAVNCSMSTDTCFCTSMNSGPKAEYGFDIALTEIVAEGEHYFVAESGSPEGKHVLENMSLIKADDSHKNAADQVIQSTVNSITKKLDPKDIKELLYKSRNSSHWNTVAERCLSCTNCTMVCPTCFCSTVEDVTDLTGASSERYRAWDSCFTGEFSHLVGGEGRKSTAARYRHWITHKLGSWHDQFGESGCVGCGRCITWCPAGIDITEEIASLRTVDDEGKVYHYE